MSDYYVGEIRVFAGLFAPEGWVPCDGRSLAIADYQTLYSVIGTTFGGNATAFNIPDLRSRLVVGSGSGGVDPSNQPLTPRVLGQTGGATQVTLQAANNPAHSHNFQVSTAAATSTSPANNAPAAPPANIGFYEPSASVSATQNLAAGAVGTAFGGVPHTNQMPSLTLNYIIATQGIYPTFP